MHPFATPFDDDDADHPKYDRDWFPPAEPYRPPYDVVDGEHVERLTHLVLVDGRLVDMWSEAVDGTRWQHHAERFDRQLRRPAPVPPAPPRPPYERALAWLADLCGGEAAVGGLHAEPLGHEDTDLPEVPDAQSRGRLAAVAELLDAVAERWFDEETSLAFRRALLRLWAVEPEVVLDAASAAHVAGGLCWVVAKANGLLSPQGELRVGPLKDSLALSVSPSTYGKVVLRALRGFREDPRDTRWRPEGLPDLLATGHPDLLLAQVRRRLVRVRDRAREAQAEVSAA